MGKSKIDPGEVLEIHLRDAHENLVANAHEIAKLLKEQGSGMALAQLFHDATLGRKQIIELAKALIPYRSPKLESVEVKQTIEHKFAIFSPEPIKKIGDFFDAVGKEKLDPIITKNAPKMIDMVLDTPEVVYKTDEKEEPDDLYTSE